MIVKDKKKLLLRDSHPSRITTVIPTSKMVNYKGTDLVVCPHDIDEVRVLNNMGYNLPSPISQYYGWPSRYDKPMEAQSVTASNLTLDPRHFVLNEIGTGKTLSTLWAFDYLRSVGRARCMLVVTPLSTMESVWSNEIWEHLPHMTCQVLYGTAERRVRQLEFPADVYVINHDGLKVPEILEALLKRKDIDVLCVDELADFKNAGTDRFKALNKLAAGKPYFWGLTGTPIPNKVTDAWAQCRLVNPSKVPQYFGKFRDMVMRQVSQYKWVPRDNALDIVKDAMQPATLFRRDECMDLPPTMYETRDVEMSADQKKAYKSMLSTLVAEAGGGQIMAVNEAVKMGKLVQIACGVAYDQKGEPLYIDSKDRVEELKRIIEASQGKVIVFIPLTGGLHSVAEEISKEWQTEVVYGDVSKTERDRIFGEFKKPGGLHVIVAHPKCMAHGLTLVTANTIVWFIPTNNPNDYTQANGRITRPGQKRNTFIIHLQGSDVEKRMYKSLKEKGTVQGILLDMIKSEIDEKNVK
jgi:SNF2 family DNA or RNA helicase